MTICTRGVDWLRRSAWPPWRRWGTLTSAPASLAPTGIPGPLPKAGVQHQAGPGRFAVVMPRVQKLNSFQPVGPATQQPPTQLTQDPESSFKPRAWSLLWSCLWLPAKTHKPWPQVHAYPQSCRLDSGAACLSHGGPWEEVGPKSWWSKVWAQVRGRAWGLCPGKQAEDSLRTLVSCCLYGPQSSHL